MAEANVRLRVTGRREVDRAMRGVVQDSRRSQREIRQEAARTARETQRQELLVYRDQRGRLRDAAGRFIRAEELKRRAIRETTREAVQAARTQEQASRRAERETRRSTGSRLAGFGRGALIGGSAVLAGGAVAVGRLRGFGSALGATTPEQQLAAADQLQRGLIVLARQGGLNRSQRTALQGKIFDVSEKYGADPLEVFRGLEVGQNRFSDLGFFAENLQAIVEASAASNTPLEEIVGTLGEFRRQMGVTSEEIPELIGTIFESARQGSVEVGDIAGSLSPTIGLFNRATGAQGVTGAREFLAVAQTLGTAGVQGSTVATYLENIFAKLTNPEIVEKFAARTGASLGVNAVTGERATLTDFLTQAASANLTESDLFEIMGQDIQARQAMGVLLKAIQDGTAQGSNPLVDLAGVDASAGRALISGTVGDLRGTAGVQIAGQNAAAIRNLTENANSFRSTIVATNGYLSEFGSKFPGLTIAAQSATAALSALGVVALLTGGGGGKGRAAAGILGRLLPGLAGAGGAGAAGAGGAAALGGLGALALGGGAVLAGSAAAIYLAREQGRPVRERAAAEDSLREQTAAALAAGDMDRARELRQQSLELESQSINPNRRRAAQGRLGVQAQEADLAGLFGGGQGGGTATVRLDGESVRAIGQEVRDGTTPRPDGSRRGAQGGPVDRAPGG